MRRSNNRGYICQIKFNKVRFTILPKLLRKLRNCRFRFLFGPAGDVYLRTMLKKGLELITFPCEYLCYFITDTAVSSCDASDLRVNAQSGVDATFPVKSGTSSIVHFAFGGN